MTLWLSDFKRSPCKPIQKKINFTVAKFRAGNRNIRTSCHLGLFFMRKKIIISPRNANNSGVQQFLWMIIGANTSHDDRGRCGRSNGGQLLGAFGPWIGNKRETRGGWLPALGCIAKAQCLSDEVCGSCHMSFGTCLSHNTCQRLVRSATRIGGNQKLDIGPTQTVSRVRFLITHHASFLTKILLDFDHWWPWWQYQRVNGRGGASYFLRNSDIWSKRLARAKQS